MLPNCWAKGLIDLAFEHCKRAGQSGDWGEGMDVLPTRADIGELYLFARSLRNMSAELAAMAKEIEGELPTLGSMAGNADIGDDVSTVETREAVASELAQISRMLRNAERRCMYAETRGRNLSAGQKARLDRETTVALRQLGVLKKQLGGDACTASRPCL